MRAVIQRVSQASVTVNKQIISHIHQGLLILLGVENGDEFSDAQWLCSKISQMRIFSDVEGKMNLSISEVEGDILVVSQFTLHASTKKGNRPSFIKAATPELARERYQQFIKEMGAITGRKVMGGEFGAMMEVALVNDGPVTIIIDSKNRE